MKTLTVLGLGLGLVGDTFGYSLESVDLKSALTIAKNVQDCGTKNKWNFSVAIVNAEGNLILLQRADAAYAGSVDAAIAKARSSAIFRRPTAVFVEAMMKDGRVGLATLPGVVAGEGGVPIIAEGNTIGAVGVSGAKGVEDAQCAVEAVTAFVGASK